MPPTKKATLTLWILAALLGGLIFGIVGHAVFPEAVNEILIKWILKPTGDVFLRAITMLVVPIVFVSLVYGAASIGDPAKLGRVGLRVMLIYLATTALAVTMALFIAEVIVRPGTGITLPTDAAFTPKDAPFIMDVFVDMVPKNPFQAMVEGNMLQVIFFALLLGIALAQLGAKAEPALRLAEISNDVLMRVVEIIIWLAVPGVFALIAKVMLEQGLGVLLPLLAYVLTLSGALLLQLALVYPLILYLFTRLSPLQFFKNHIPVMTVAFSTSSSNATLPVSIDVAERRQGVSKGIASFALPLGATINMDGTAIMQGVATAFIAQVYGIELSFTQLVTVVVTAALASVGTAGVPGVGLITLSMVLMSVKLPVEGIALIIGVDRLLDMARTVVNVTGDAATAVIVSKMENELDVEEFYAENAGTD
ncbi:MAG: dicarboxylate/amino acid:cation symporter [Calditrichaeota bacterium]|nr:dicarboxylate/amino acid:cation symporter [Calditrichota bacterium]MCB9365924.1 dicarboxylate/amino acid:cation symporter [Calditrichota bacterium]